MNKLHLRIITARQCQNRRNRKQWDHEIADTGAVDDTRSSPTHDQLWMSHRKLRQQSFDLDFVGRIAIVRSSPQRLLFRHRHWVIRPCSICRGTRGHKESLRSGFGNSRQEIPGALNIDLMHPPFVAHGIYDKGQMKNCIRVKLLYVLGKP